jgi:predicted acetyltransferase
VSDHRVDLVPVSDKNVLARHLQTYLAEHAVFTGRTPRDGVYDYPWFDAYWRDVDVRWPFWMRRDEEFVALAFVHFDATDDHFELAEFFVAERFRGQGLGDRFARDVILRFSGKWKLHQVQANARAVVFWRRVLGDLADYVEGPLRRGDGIDRIEQRFVIP